MEFGLCEQTEEGVSGDEVTICRSERRKGLLFKIEGTRLEICRSRERLGFAQNGWCSQ